MFIKNIHVSLCSINLCLENGPGKKCIWKRICQIHQIRWIKYKYKYKYMVWNLIKYKYKYKYAVFVFVFVFANTNTYLTPALVITPENFMMIRWWEHSQKGVTDKQTDGQTENTICRAAWSQLKTIGHLSYATSSFVQRFVPIGVFKLELQSRNAQSGSNSTIFSAVWPWNLTDDLQKQ